MRESVDWERKSMRERASPTEIERQRESFGYV